MAEAQRTVNEDLRFYRRVLCDKLYLLEAELARKDGAGEPHLCGGFNAGNVGIVLLGDFTSRQPTAAARQSLTYVLAAIVALGGLNPLGTTNYVNPISGASKTVPTIPGHRDWVATLCPGDLFYPELAGVRRDVADILG